VRPYLTTREGFTNFPGFSRTLNWLSENTFGEEKGTRVRGGLDLLVRPGGCCSLCHTVQCNSRDEGSKCLPDSARHVIGCRLTQETRARQTLLATSQGTV
jgi:hypothetical protein